MILMLNFQAKLSYHDECQEERNNANQTDEQRNVGQIEDTLPSKLVGYRLTNNVT
jgi:hypothetical protein